MKVLLVGGAGMVGTFITPYLQSKHSVRVLDLQEPQHSGVEYVKGSITKLEDVQQALDGVDTFINMVMRSPQGGSSTEQTPTQIVENYQVNTLGLHLLLWAAQGMGVRRGVHTSTMSVHYRERTWYAAEESVPFDTPSVYGLTKGFGEHICQYFARWFDMNLIALRISGPRTRTEFVAERRAPSANVPHAHLYWTDEEILLAPTWRRSKQCRLVMAASRRLFVVGDEAEEEHN